MNKRKFLITNIIMFLIILSVFIVVICVGRSGNEKLSKGTVYELNTEDTQKQYVQGDKSENSTDTGFSDNSDNTDGTVNKGDTTVDVSKLTPVQVEWIDFERVSRDSINIMWSDTMDEYTDKYLIMRRLSKGRSDWSIVGEVSTTSLGIGTHSYIDNLQDDGINQYEYMVNISVKDENEYRPVDSQVKLASNLMICIDPGHYAGKNKVDLQESYGCYAEGDFTIKIGLALRDILKNEYGIDSYMTRETGSITLSGKTDYSLDSTAISLRGSYAEDKNSDLFISLHTNANNDNANGCDTYMQPVSANKTIILANLIAGADDRIINVCNSIGINISGISYREGISSSDEFLAVSANNVKVWTERYNDGINLPGTVFLRIGDDGKDYYGVLRGAAGVNIPGIIVEHGLHTVREVRQAAMTTDLSRKWAEADAYGIAYGFGFEDVIEKQK